MSSVACKTERIVCSAADYSGCVIDDVQIQGNEALSDETIEAKIASAPTGGTFEAIPLIGVVDALTLQYERFDRFVFERDLERIARLYKAKGYYDVVVRAGRVRRIDKHKPNPDSKDVSHVRLLVEVEVHEGEPILIEAVSLEFDGEPTGDKESVDAARDAKNYLKVGQVFSEEDYEITRERIKRTLTERGFAHARVEPKASIDARRHRAVVSFTIWLGPICTFGKVEILGLKGGRDELPEWQVRPAVNIEQGAQYNSKALEEAEIALSALGVFGSISVTPVLKPEKAAPQAQLPPAPERKTLDREPPEPPEQLPTEIPILVRVQPSYLGAWKAGGGFELGDQVAIRGVAGWSYKDATNALDRLSLDGRFRGVIYPWRISTFASGGASFLPELKLRVQYSLPFPADPAGSLLVQTTVSYGLETNHDAPSQEEFEKNKVIPVEILLEHRQGYERRFFRSRLLLGVYGYVAYSSPFLFPFDTAVDSSPLVITYLDLFAQVDLRLNRDGKPERIKPAMGILTSVDFQVGGAFGGDATDLRVKPELRWYAPLGKHLVLAGRAAFGLLYTIDKSYGLLLDTPIPADHALEGTSATSERRAILRDQEILAKRAFFSGGPSSNRGYGFNEIGPHTVVNDNGVTTDDPNAIGGRSLWEMSLELRFPIYRTWGGTAFVDASDVTAAFADFRLDHPHLSTGLGVNYDSPIGPFRVDFGFRIPYAQVIGREAVRDCTGDVERDKSWGCANLVIDEAEPLTLGGVPMAISIAIGNAF